MKEDLTAQALEYMRMQIIPLLRGIFSLTLPLSGTMHTAEMGACGDSLSMQYRHRPQRSRVDSIGRRVEHAPDFYHRLTAYPPLTPYTKQG